MIRAQLIFVFVFIVWKVQPLMNSTSVLKTKEQIYLNEMLNDWSKKCWLTQCKQLN